MGIQIVALRDTLPQNRNNVEEGDSQYQQHYVVTPQKTTGAAELTSVKRNSAPCQLTKDV